MAFGKRNSRTKCSLCEDYWKQTDSQYLAYSGETHCTYIDTIKATNQASCAPAQRTFSVLEVPSLSYIDLNYDEFCRFIENEVQDFFQPEDDNVIQGCRGHETSSHQCHQYQQ